MEAIREGDKWYELYQDRGDWFKLCCERYGECQRPGREMNVQPITSLNQVIFNVLVGEAFVDKET